MKPRLNCTRMTGKRKVWRRTETAHEPKHNMSPVKHGRGSVTVWVAS